MDSAEKQKPRASKLPDEFEPTQLISKFWNFIQSSH